MTASLTGADFQLRWPRTLLRSEIAQLMNDRQEDQQSWSRRGTLLLKDAFVGSEPSERFERLARSMGGTTDPSTQEGWLALILRRADALRSVSSRAPYYSERKGGVASGSISFSAVVRGFVAVFDDLNERGYFEQAFGKDCVDDPATINPGDVITKMVGREDLWPIDVAELSSNPDAFYDLVEVLHDLVSRPRDAWFHSFGRCGDHYERFSIDAGRTLYAWLVNQVLEQGGLGLRLATDGEDAGRLVESTDEARSALSQKMNAREGDTGDEVRHAMALHRGRNATEHEKRSAVVVLAGVLEGRRRLLKKELASKDEGDLFNIANNFAIRHQNPNQQGDYAPFFLDWLFWWYLATIDLTDQMLARQQAPRSQ